MLIIHVSLIELQKWITSEDETIVFIRFCCNCMEVNYSTSLYHLSGHLKHVISSLLIKKNMMNDQNCYILN